MAGAEGTVVYATIKEGTPNHCAKRAFRRLLSKWGDQVTARVLATTHMFSHTNELRIQSWKVGEDLPKAM